MTDDKAIATALGRKLADIDQQINLLQQRKAQIVGVIQMLNPNSSVSLQAHQAMNPNRAASHSGNLSSTLSATGALEQIFVSSPGVDWTPDALGVRFMEMVRQGEAQTESDNLRNTIHSGLRRLMAKGLLDKSKSGKSVRYRYVPKKDASPALQGEEAS